MQRSLHEAAGKLSKHDAILARAMAANTARSQKALEQYQIALKELMDGQVLAKLDLKEKREIASRRAIVERFLKVNAMLRDLAASSEDRIQADLLAGGWSQTQTTRFMAGYHRNNEQITAIVLEIREHDERVGSAIVGALNLLEQHWGAWTYDADAEVVHFEDDAVVGKYEEFMNAMESAGAAQVKLQERMLTVWKQSRAE
jgi:hypothetical protein